jgi:hypothetical protein
VTGPLAPQLESLLERASFCHVAVSTPFGPHVTPVVFALWGDRIWATTARSSTKAHAWRRDDRTAGLVDDGALALSFTARARTFDVLDPRTWGASLLEAPTLSLATVRFAAKNARFFAGYAVDARSVPFAWLPPGRLFVELSIDASRPWIPAGPGSKRSARSVPSVERFRAGRPSDDPLGLLPPEVAGAVGRAGSGALAISSPGLAVVPVRWAVDRGRVYAALPSPMLEGVERPRIGVALGVDRPTWWRARHMVGAMVQGTGEVAVLKRLTSGRRSAAEIVSGMEMDEEGAALVRIDPARLVWWRGWSSGSAWVTPRPASERREQRA